MHYFKTLFLSFLFLSLGAWAQHGKGMDKMRGMEGREDRFGMITKALDLSADQLEKIKEIRTSYHDKIKARREELKLGAKMMLPMMSATETEDSLRASYKKSQALKTELDNERFEMMLSVRKILTVEQRKKASELMKKHHEERGPHWEDRP